MKLHEFKKRTAEPLFQSFFFDLTGSFFGWRLG
jgi:hypothetical protein